MNVTESLFLILAGLYYVITGIFVLFSAFTIYILVRYGSSRTVALTTSLIYILFFLIVLSISLNTLQSIQF